MVQPAEGSLRDVTRGEERREREKFGTEDYYNSEGQLRNYERSLKSLKPGGGGGDKAADGGSEASCG